MSTDVFTIHCDALGWHFPLRKGTEVMVSFQGGDPDRPVIAGVVPNALTPSNVTNRNHTQGPRRRTQVGLRGWALHLRIRIEAGNNGAFCRANRGKN